MALLDLPHDLLVVVVRQLDADQLGVLSQTCSTLHALVSPPPLALAARPL